MSMASDIYAARRARRAAQAPGYQPPKTEDAEAPAKAQHDTLGAMMVGQSAFAAKPGKSALPDAAAVYARRKAQRAARPAGSGDSEE